MNPEHHFTDFPRANYLRLIRQLRSFFQIAGSDLFAMIDENHPHNSLSLWERARGRVFRPGRTLASALIPA